MSNYKQAARFEGDAVEYRGFTIKTNEYGSFNVPTINCWCTSSLQYAKDAIDRYVDLCYRQRAATGAR